MFFAIILCYCVMLKADRMAQIYLFFIESKKYILFIEPPAYLKSGGKTVIASIAQLRIGPLPLYNAA
jgi:hypothetical protein